MWRKPLLIAILLVLAIAAGAVWWWLRPPVSGPLRLVPVAFSDLPDWQASDPRAALSAFLRSCARHSGRKPAEAIGAYAGSVGDWGAACGAAAQSPLDAAGARKFFETYFAPLAVQAGEVRDGLFTGYYEPQLRASHTRHGRYSVPVYGLPSDLVSVDLGLFRDTLRGERIAGRAVDGKLVPYPSRAEIDAKGLPTAPVLLYADDPVAVFFLHIQGSGRVVFDDGVTGRIAYAGTNSRPYTAIGRILKAQGALDPKNISLQTIRAWLLAHPDKARAVMESDASFVFFKNAPLGDPALGSPGAGNVPLTPGASIAVDPRIHPFGVPFYISTTMPVTDEKLRRLFVSQDIGGAIRNPVRADIFWGFGQQAEEIAGRMQQSGRMYVLLPKPVATRLAKDKP